MSWENSFITFLPISKRLPIKKFEKDFQLKSSQNRVNKHINYLNMIINCVQSYWNLRLLKMFQDHYKYTIKMV